MIMTMEGGAARSRVAHARADTDADFAWDSGPVPAGAHGLDGGPVRDPVRDPVRWSAVWAGILAALATFILLELVAFWLGWLSFGERGGSTAGWGTALIGALAFLVGGLVAGGTSIWTSAREGMVHGMLVWALGIVGITLLTLLGGGALLGSVADAVTQTVELRNGDIAEGELRRTVSAAREASGWAVLGLVAYLVAAVIGGIAGVKTGSARRARRRHVSGTHTG